MATPSLPHPAIVLADVESFFDSLPTTRRRKRTATDDSPESENYTTGTPEPDNPALAQFRLLLFQLGQARSDVAAEYITWKIYRLLDLPLDGGK